MSGPRQAPRPRTGAGPRSPGRARRTRGAAVPARASQQRLAARGEPGREAVGAGRPAVPENELSTWQLLLAQFDAFLRDPTIARALAASLARTSAAVRAAGAALRDAARRIARALRGIRVPFPRRVLLGLLALTLPFALLALLASSDDERRTRDATQQASRSAAAAGGGFALPGVGMPQVRLAPDKVPQVRVALVVDGAYDQAALRRELRALGGWLAANHAPGTRVSVIDGASARASGALPASALASARPRRQRASTAAAVRSAFAREPERRLLVAVGDAAAPRSARASTLRVTTRRGAAAGAPSGALQRSRQARVTIDERRPNALAASIARAIMAISGQGERR